MNLRNLNTGYLKQQFHRIPEALRSILILSFLLGAIVTVKFFTKRYANQPQSGEKLNIDTTIDTIIPDGFVLVPIEISNIESISSMIGTQAVIDLYKFDEKGRSNKIASKVKVLRAPYNPSVYAVLVKETQSGILMKHQGAFYAAIQNEKATGGVFTSPPAVKPKKISISYSP